MTAFVAALSPLRDMDPDDKPSLSSFLQKHYKEMDEADMEEALTRIAAEVKKRYDPTLPERYPAGWSETVKSLQRRQDPACLLGNGTFGLYSQLRSWAGTEGISYMFYDDPALVEDMIEFNTEFLLTLVERADD